MHQTYIPKHVSGEAYCYSGLMLTDGKDCKHSNHQNRAKIVNSVEQKKVTFKVWSNAKYGLILRSEYRLNLAGAWKFEIGICRSAQGM